MEGPGSAFASRLSTIVDRGQANATSPANHFAEEWRLWDHIPFRPSHSLIADGPLPY